jgi:hypothetical protein
MLPVDISKKIETSPGVATLSVTKWSRRAQYERSTVPAGRGNARQQRTLIILRPALAHRGQRGLPSARSGSR